MKSKVCLKYFINNCSCMCLGKTNNDNGNLSFNDFNLKNSDEGTVLAIKIERKVPFNDHCKTYVQMQVKTCAHI